MSAAPRCDDLHAFYDGELPPPERESFRDHLGACARCQQELDTVIQLGALGTDLAAEQRAANEVTSKDVDVRPAAPPIDLAAAAAKRRSRNARLGGAAGLLAAAAAVAVVAVVALPRSSPNPFALGQTRSIEARLTHPGARAWRPYDVQRSAWAEPEAVPLTSLASLEQRGDKAGVATGHILRGERDAAQRLLAQAPASPDLKSDSAVLALQRGAADEALLLLDGVLQERPGHPQALWNRGLALRELGLPLAAAEVFSDVVKLREPGWAEEAAERASSLTAEAARAEASFNAARGAGSAMLRGGAPVSANLARAHPAIARVWLYDSLRSAPTPERVRELQPLAALLDGLFGGDVLQRLVARVAASDFRRRAPLAARYQQLVTGKLDAKATAGLLADTERAGFPDIRLGVLFTTRRHGEHLTEVQSIAAWFGDPWPANIALHESAMRERARRPVETERKLREALQHALVNRLEARAVQIELELTLLGNMLLRPGEAWSHGLSAQRLARRTGDHRSQTIAVYRLATAARLRTAYSLSRAFLREYLLREGSLCRTKNFVFNALADLALLELKPAEARRHFEASPSCGAPVIHELDILADIGRLDPRPGDLERMRKDAQALRSAATATPADKLFADTMEGRLLLHYDPAAAIPMLRGVIARVDAASPGNDELAGARAYAYLALEVEAGRRGEWPEVLALLAAEAGVAAPSRCAVGLAVDDARSVIAVVGARGEAQGLHEAARREPRWKWAPRISGDLLGALRGCEVVDVIARPPVHGRSDLLPAEVAWRYRVRSDRPAATAAGGKRLVVDDVEAPAALNLPRLAPGPAGSADAGRMELRGPSATPSRVLAAMRDAAEIEIHAHGILSAEVSDAATLVLSPDEDGTYALTARDVRGARLEAAPVVTLAACRGARPGDTYVVAESLPVAFLHAGARAVFAAATDVQDAQARPFFRGVRERMRHGRTPAEALRDERVAWATRPGAQWAAGVLLFE